MEQGLFYEVSGMLASVAMILGYLPQAIQTIRTRNTDGIAMPTFIMMFVGAIFFVIQALLHEPEVIWSLFLTNTVTGTCSLIVFVIKIYNDYSKKNNHFFY